MMEASQADGTSSAAPKPPAGLEERTSRLNKVVNRNPTHREIHYKTLRYCLTQRLEHEVEEHIASFPEFGYASQSPYHLLSFLVESGGIDVIELDHDGLPIAPERVSGLSEDEHDDLVAQYSYKTNDAGERLVEQMSPKNRLEELLGIVPDYYETYIEVLGFLQERHDLGSIDTLLRGRDVLMAGRDPDDRPIQPSVFIDKLEKAGGIYWENGWLITSEGKELLDTLREKKED
ncbi:MAG: hypothetical protein LBD25_02365 [Coriobacteriales bacterium]|jgi:hypothetical protein|nr:hypothetical protein [Coriobacteriales bacterium]